jgi:hypothetical protein
MTDKMLGGYLNGVLLTVFKCVKIQLAISAIVRFATMASTHYSKNPVFLDDCR